MALLQAIGFEQLLSPSAAADGIRFIFIRTTHDPAIQVQRIL